LNAIHWTLLFILNGHGAVTGIVNDASSDADFARCEASAQQTARVVTAHADADTAAVGTCVTLTGSQMAEALVAAAATYDCQRGSPSVYLCSGTRRLL
jgi:hypothetical protein